MNKEALGTLLAVLTAVVSGFAIPINKMFLVGLDPVVFTAVRALIIGVVFFIIASAQCKFDFKKFKQTQWSWLLLIGVIGGGLAFLLYFSGLQLTTSGRGAFLHKTLPLYVAVLAYVFLREKFDLKQSLALVAMLAGTAAIYYTQIAPGAMWANPGLGDVLIILGTILWAVEAIIARKVMKDGESNFVVVFGRMFFGALVLWGAVIVLGRWDLILELSAIQLRNLFISTGILTLYVLFWFGSLKFINVSKAAMILLLAPVISLIAGIYWFGEPAPMLQLVGSGLILIGAAFVVKMKSELVSGV
ncbi:MAG: DMT family transporter [archaeon]